MQLIETRQALAGGAAALVGRALIASLFVVSAFGKMAAPDATRGYIAAFGLPLPGAVYVGTIGFELAASLLLLLGWHTRVAAALLLAFTLATAFIFHTQFGNQNELVHFLKNLAIAGGLLHVVLHGGGSWSLDSQEPAARAMVAAR